MLHQTRDLPAKGSSERMLIMIISKCNAKRCNIIILKYCKTFAKTFLNSDTKVTTQHAHDKWQNERLNVLEFSEGITLLSQIQVPSNVKQIVTYKGFIHSER